MYISVDRIADGIAVCEKEDMTTVGIPLSELPDGTKEGSVLLLKDDGSYSIDINEESKRKKRILDLQSMLFDE